MRDMGVMEGATTEMGPNDASGVVWAIGKFFFFSFMLN